MYGKKQAPFQLMMTSGLNLLKMMTMIAKCCPMTMLMVIINIIGSIMNAAQRPMPFVNTLLQVIHQRNRTILKLIVEVMTFTNKIHFLFKKILHSIARI